MTSNYYKKDMNEAALGKFYTMLADASSHSRHDLQHAGQLRGECSSSLTLKLAAHPNIDGDQGQRRQHRPDIRSAAAKAPEGFSVFAGSEAISLPHFVCSAVSAGPWRLQTWFPTTAPRSGEESPACGPEKARKMQLALLPQRGRYQPLRSAEREGRHGYGRLQGWPPRPPILPAGEEMAKGDRQISRSLGIPTVSKMIVSVIVSC